MLKQREFLNLRRLRTFEILILLEGTLRVIYLFIYTGKAFGTKKLGETSRGLVRISRKYKE